MENNVLVSHVLVVLHSVVDAAVVKHQFMLALQVPIGMVTDAFSLLTSVQQVWFGITIAVNQILLNALAILMNLMEHVFLCQLNAHQVLLGTTPMDVFQLLILAQLDLIIMESNVSHINHVIVEKYGMILYLNAYVLQDHSQMVNNVLHVPLVNSMQLEVVIAQMEHSLMELNVQH